MSKICVIKGDGIGPEVVDSAIEILNKAAEKFNFKLDYNYTLMGGIAIDETGVPLPKETVNAAKASDAVLLGAVGGAKWDNLPGDKRPEAGLLGIRKALGLYANIRPAKLFTPLINACPLRRRVIKNGLDLVIVRELTGGAYFGKKRTVTKDGVKSASDLMIYSDFEIGRIVETAFEIASKRKKSVCSVEKANVLESSRLWREIARKVADRHPEIQYSEMLVDNCAMQLVRNPSQFDVIVTENLFGDILSDEAAMLTGSLGMLPSASLNETSFGLYEPVHGSAPDIAGKNIANPCATILSATMMLRYSLGLSEAADAIEAAVEAVLADGYRTRDIAEEGCRVVGTDEMTELIKGKI
ncbi:MAG: 3-isopropylmalate dehydrogenase [Ruminococcus sp.]|jgi:3-isopropylmalate dehydrogenase|nr:3-isopropylmalate dehydrogenase [Ruminococcus sp.]